MNRQFLFRKASVIHAIKCAIATDFDLAIESFNRLLQFRGRIADANEQEFQQIDSELNDWANTQPVAIAGEINRIMYGN